MQWNIGLKLLNIYIELASTFQHKRFQNSLLTRTGSTEGPETVSDNSVAPEQSAPPSSDSFQPHWLD